MKWDDGMVEWWNRIFLLFRFDFVALLVGEVFLLCGFDMIDKKNQDIRMNEASKHGFSQAVLSIGTSGRYLVIRLGSGVWSAVELPENK